MGIETIVPGVLGAVGLYQSSQSQKKQDKALKSASDIQKAMGKEQFSALQQLNTLAGQYDPAKQTKIAVDAATKSTSQALERAFSNLRAKRGNFTGDSEYHVQAQRGVNDQMDPLKMFVAEQLAAEPMKKAAMLQTVLGAPVGQIADSYFKSAAMMPRSDPTASMGLLSQALERMLAKPGGAGGSGDNWGLPSQNALGGL